MLRRPRHQATVTAVASDAPGLVRITLSVPAFRVTGPTQWVKLFVPGPDRRPVARHYTVRQRGDQLVDLEIVLHGNGPGSRWAARARPGQLIELAGPNGSFTVPPSVDYCLLAGDHSARAAVRSIADTLPPSVRAYTVIEQDSTALHKAVLGLERPVGRGFAWVAGEFESIRRHLLADLGIARRDCHTKGYWRRPPVS